MFPKERGLNPTLFLNRDMGNRRMSKFNNIFKNPYVFSVISKLLIVALGFAYSVCQARYLGTSLKGDVAYVDSVTKITLVLFGLGIHQAYPYFKKKTGQNVHARNTRCTPPTSFQTSLLESKKFIEMKLEAFSSDTSESVINAELSRSMPSIDLPELRNAPRSEPIISALPPDEPERELPSPKSEPRGEPVPPAAI